MKSVTIHGLDNELDRLLRAEAASKGLSLNKTVKQILRRSLGLTRRNTEKRDISKFVGVWTKKEADAIDKVLEDFEKVDEEDWK